MLINITCICGQKLTRHVPVLVLFCDWLVRLGGARVRSYQHLPQSFKVSCASFDSAEHFSSTNCPMLTRCSLRKASNVSLSWFLLTGSHKRERISPSLNSSVALSFAAILSAFFLADDRSTFSRETKTCVRSLSGKVDNSSSSVLLYSVNLNVKKMALCKKKICNEY